ncbi:hypothetical protein GW17_00047778 [Ensete ventricosum]|nr:hypothetical protein GW17_00047778 [Ensete ventricosum]
MKLRTTGFLGGSEVRKGFRQLGCLGGGEPAGVDEVFHREVGIWRYGAAYSGGRVHRGGEEEEISKAAGFEQGQEALATDYGAKRSVAAAIVRREKPRRHPYTNNPLCL